MRKTMCFVIPKFYFGVFIILVFSLVAILEVQTTIAENNDEQLSSFIDTFVATSTKIALSNPNTTTTQSVTPSASPCQLTNDGKYDVLCYINPQPGSEVPSRSCSSSSPNPCYPTTIKSPIQFGNGSNGGGNYQKANVFYYLKDRPGANGTSFEKYGYDENSIWIIRDSDWGDGEPVGANGNDYVGTFPVNPDPPDQNCSYLSIQPGDWCMPDASGALRQGGAPSFLRVTPGTPTTGIWANRYMSVGEFLSVPGFPNNNVPGHVKAFYRNRSNGTWYYV